MWERDSNRWTHIPTSINSICGGWAKLANGNVGMFAGHYQTLEVRGARKGCLGTSSSPAAALFWPGAGPSLAL
jgi:hypothetical protein